MEEKIIKEENFDTTEVEKTESEEKELSLGKFKDVKSLLSAYNSLQSEFTKRCQKVKELEGIITDNLTKPVKEEGNLSEEKKEEIIKNYLKDILFSKKDAVVMDGSGITVKTPYNRPKTIGEAGELAKKFMQEKN